MSFEFKLKRNKGRTKHKFNRHEIWNKLGDIKHLSMHKNPLGWNMAVNDTYPSLWHDMHKFIDKNIGKDVNNVYSEFLKKIRSQKHYNYHIKEIFFKYFDGYPFIIGSDNKIHKRTYKSRSKRYDYISYNLKHINDKVIPKRFVNGPYYIGNFYTNKGDYLPVWIVSTLKYNTVGNAVNNKLQPCFYIDDLNSLVLHTSSKWFELRNFNIIKLFGLGHTCTLENITNKILITWCYKKGIKCYFITKK